MDDGGGFPSTKGAEGARECSPLSFHDRNVESYKMMNETGIGKSYRGEGGLLLLLLILNDTLFKSFLKRYQLSQMAILLETLSTLKPL